MRIESRLLAAERQLNVEKEAIEVMGVTFISEPFSNLCES
jgi:hypothetical protein